MLMATYLDGDGEKCHGGFPELTDHEDVREFLERRGCRVLEVVDGDRENAILWRPSLAEA